MRPQLQYRWFVNLTKVINASDFNISLIAIAAYAALLGEISEKNLLSIFRYASINSSDPVVITMFGFYTRTGLMRIKDDGVGFTRSLDRIADDIFEDVNDQIIEEARIAMEEIRRRYLADE